MSKKANHFSEMSVGDSVRTPYASYQTWFEEQQVERLSRKAQEAEAFFRRTGITFNVYGQDDAEERLIPFDLVPRIISAREWTKLSKGIEQRVRAINAFRAFRRPSMCTAIRGTRALIHLIYGGRRVQKLSIGGGH